MRRLEVGAVPVECGQWCALFKCLLRVHLLALERKLNGYNLSQHPAVTWLVGRTEVREKVISEKPYIVMGACLDRWQTGPRRDKRCEVEHKVLVNFLMVVYETSMAHASTWGSPRMEALREHARCGVIPGKRGAQ